MIVHRTQIRMRRALLIQRVPRWPTSATPYTVMSMDDRRFCGDRVSALRSARGLR